MKQIFRLHWAKNIRQESFKKNGCSQDSYFSKIWQLRLTDWEFVGTRLEGECESSMPSSRFRPCLGLRSHILFDKK